MSLWHSIKVRLGLEDDYDDGYEEDEYYNEEEDEPVPSRPYRSPYGDNTAVKRVDRQPDLERARFAVREHGASVSHIQPVEAPQVKMHIVEPRTFSEAQSIGDKFRDDTPVIMNLTGTTPDVAKRLVDFASGLTYGLGGGLQKVSEKVFMLTPANVDVSAADRRRLKDKGLFTLDE